MKTTQQACVWKQLFLQKTTSVRFSNPVMILLMFGKQEVECVNGTGEALDVLLSDLARVNNSRERASKLFQWLISPTPAEAFFRSESYTRCFFCTAKEKMT